jgi:hypothetical protein
MPSVSSLVVDQILAPTAMSIYAPPPALGLSAHASLMGQKGDGLAAGDSGDTTSQVVQDIV